MADRVNNNQPTDYYMALQSQLNQWNRESAAEQMRFQDYMSSTAHQREVKDLVAAGLNPVLSANNGAASLPGAYAGIDSSPISAKMAEKQLKMSLDAQMYMNKYQVDQGYKLGIAQAGIAANAAITGASMAAAASMYGANQSYAASAYATDMQWKNNEAQRAWDAMHPNNGYQATGTIIDYLFNGPGKGPGSSYTPGSSSAK